MSLYFHLATQGFYDSEIHAILPENVVAISEEKHAQLLDAINQGCLIFDDLSFSPPRPSVFHEWDNKKNAWQLSELKKLEQRTQMAQRFAKDIDDVAAEQLAKPARFQAEYQLRETQALAFEASGFQGEAPEQVAAFAQAAHLSHEAAAKTILQQAKMLRTALSKIGVLRMRKFELSHCETVEEMENLTREIVQKLYAIGEKL